MIFDMFDISLGVNYTANHGHISLGVYMYTYGSICVWSRCVCMYVCLCVYI